MENEISNMNTNIGNKEVKVVNLVKKDALLFIELSNNRKFLTDGTLIQEFSEYKYFHDVYEMNGIIYVVMEKDWQNHLVDFTTKEIIVSFANYSYYYSKISEDTFQIGEKLFSLKTREYIPNTENLKPQMFCYLSNDLYLFETTKEDYLERRTLILNEKGEQLLDCGKAWPYLVEDNLILSDSKQEEIRIEKYKDGKFDKEHEIVIKKAQTKPHYYQGNICIVKNNNVYVINPNQEILRQFPLPLLGTITDSTIENDTLLMYIKINENIKIVGINLINGKHFEAERIGIRPLDMVGPATKITIARNNITYDKHGNDICCDVTLLDENFNVLYNLCNVINYDYIVCDKVDKIWLKQEKGGILYNASKQKSIETPYGDINFQFNDENTKIEYGFGLDEITDKLQIIDEEGNILINSIPYKELGIEPYFGQFGFRYLNGYACIKKRKTIDIDYEITIDSIIDKNGKIIYRKQNVHVYPIGNYFQIKKEDKTIYFNTLTGEFNEKTINYSKIPLLEEQEQFEITEDGALVLKQTLSK